MKIPQYERKVQPAGSLGIPRKDPNMYQARDNAVKGVLNKADELVTKFEDKQANILLIEEKNRLTKKYQQQYLDDSLNRQGAAGGADEEAGIKNIHDAFNDLSTEEMQSSMAKFSGRHQDKAFEQLTALTMQYNNNFANLNAKSIQVRRDDAANTLTETTQDELALAAMNIHVTTAEVKSIINDYGKSHRELTGGRDMTGAIKAKQDNLMKSAVMSLAKDQPEKAKQLLDEIRAEVDPVALKTMDNAIETSRVKHAADSIMAELSGLEYKEQLNVVAGMKNDEAVSNAVATRIEIQNNKQIRVKNIQITERMEVLWDATKDITNPGVTASEIESDPLLTGSQKDYYLNRLKGKADTESKKLAQNLNLYYLSDKIRRGKATMDDAIQMAKDMQIDSGQLKSLRQMEIDRGMFKSLGVSTQLTVDQYADELATPEAKYNFFTELYRNVNNQQNKTGYQMGSEEVLSLANDLMKREREKQWFHKIPFVPDPKKNYKTEGASTIYIDRRLKDIRLGNPNAVYVPQSDVFYLGRENDIDRFMDWNGEEFEQPYLGGTGRPE